MKHVLLESPLERADRLIRELRTPEWFSGPPRHHATDNRHQQRLELMREFFSFSVRYALGADASDFANRLVMAVKPLMKNEMETQR